MRGDHRYSGIPRPRREHPGGPPRRPAALTHLQHGAHQCADHVVAERVRHHRRLGHGRPGPRPVQAQQRAHRAGPFAAAAERGEVVLPQAGLCRLVHDGDVEPAPVPERGVPGQRIRQFGVVADPVGVPAPDRGEPGVEPGRGGGEQVHAHVGRKQPGQPPGSGQACAGPAVCRDVGVCHLAARVDPGVGAAGHGQRRGFRQVQHAGEPVFQGLLYRPPAGLAGPAGKARAVVGDVEPDPEQRRAPGAGAVRLRAQRPGTPCVTQRPPSPRPRAAPPPRPPRAPRPSAPWARLHAPRPRRPPAPRRRLRRSPGRPCRPWAAACGPAPGHGGGGGGATGRRWPLLRPVR